MIVNTTTKLTEQDRQVIADELQRRKAVQPCPRCKYSQFIILDAYGSVSVTTRFAPTGLHPGMMPPPGFPIPTEFPTVVTVCGNCGFVSQHNNSLLPLLICAVGAHS